MRVHRHGPYLRLVFVHRIEGTRLPEFLRIAPANKMLHVPRKSGDWTRVVAFHSVRLHRWKNQMDRIKFVHQGRAGPGHVHEHA